MSPETVARWLRTRREALGLSRQQLAMKTGGEVSYSSIVKYEDGQMMPSPRAFRSLADALGVDPAWLMRLAGYLPAEAAAQPPAPVEPRPIAFRDALKADANLTPAEKRAMQQLYDTFVRERRR